MAKPPTNLPGPILSAAALSINVARVRWRARGSDAVVLHNGRFKAIPTRILIDLFCRANRGRFALPPDLTILLVHNRPGKTLMELSLDYLGIAGYTVIRLPAGRPWRHTARITAVLDYLRSGRCTTEYVLWADCDDALFRDDPAVTIDLLKQANCEMLVSSTSFDGYRNMPDVKQWTTQLGQAEARQRRRPNIHLNAGVLIARTDFLQEYLTEASTFVTENDLPAGALRRLSDAEILRLLPEFPRGTGSDQRIMRYLFPRFYPRMKIDYDSRLALR